MKHFLNIFNIFLLIASIIFFSATSLYSQTKQSNTHKRVQDVTVGAFKIKIPADWKVFNSSESAQMKRQYIAQSAEIYAQYSGASDPARSVDIAAFHISGDAGAFVMVSFTVPPQSNLVTLLKSQAEEKAKWGIQQGYIKKYLGFVSLDDEKFSGFYVKCIGTNGEMQISGGLEHKNLKNTMVQITLLCPKSWDQDMAVHIFSALLNSVGLKKAQ
jgi:hypothetical protein